MVEVNPELVKAFHLMWDHYPGPCSLIYKTREVVAVNPACQSIPREVGSICARELPAEKHKGCKANAALETHMAQGVRKRSADGTEYAAYWLPIDGYADFYLPFSTKIAADYE